MPISRMDLADVSSPEKIVELILEAEPDLPLPIPIEDICFRLNIIKIEELSTDGFEGGLITDADRSEGIILVKKGFELRRRFTIAHELGHFLMPHHVPDRTGQFLCKSSDLLRLTAKEGDRRQRMEVEANRFASLLLMPPKLLRSAMRDFRDPNIQHVLILSRKFGVSKEAMSRSYVQYHSEMIAIVLIQNGKILRFYKNTEFPFISCAGGDVVPVGSLYHRHSHQYGVASEFAECIPDNWIDVKRGERAPILYEQFYPQRNGYGLLLLHVERVDEDEEAEESRLEESYRIGFNSKKKRP